MRIKITKLAPSYNPAVMTAGNIEEYKGHAGGEFSPPVNYWVEGDIICGFAEGDCLMLERYVKNGVPSLGWFTTSRIKEIHWDLGKFETCNSIYRFEFLGSDKDFVRSIGANG